MDVQRLRVLRAFADRGTMEAAAAAVHCTPSAVSQQLKLLQHEARTPLLVRKGRRAQLTDAGRALADASVDVFVALERAEAALADFRSGTVVTIRAAMFPSGAEMLLPRTLGWLADNAPRVRLEANLEEPPWQRFADLTSDYDLVVAHSAAGVQVWPDSVVAHRLLREPLDIAVCADHPLADRESLTAADVAAYPWIGVPEEYPFRTVIAGIEERAGRSIQMAHRFPDLRTIEALIGSGMGIGLLSRHTARPDVERPFVLKELRDIEASRTLAVLLRRDQAENPAVRKVVQALVHAGAELDVAGTVS